MSTEGPTPLVGKKKDDTSPTSFLPGLKGFNIDNTKYKHYGHSMDSQQLHHIINEAKDPKTKSRSSSVESQNLVSPLEFASLPKSLEMDPSRTYSEPVLKEMLRLRVEQERTRQISAKYHLGRMVMELIREASAHGFDSELIRKLFLDEDSESRRQLSELVLKKNDSQGQDPTQHPDDSDPIPHPKDDHPNNQHQHPVSHPNSHPTSHPTSHPSHPTHSVVCTPSPKLSTAPTQATSSAVSAEGSENGRFYDRKEIFRARGSDPGPSFSPPANTSPGQNFSPPGQNLSPQAHLSPQPQHLSPSGPNFSPPGPPVYGPVYYAVPEKDKDSKDDPQYPVVYRSPQFLRQESSSMGQGPNQTPQHVLPPQSYYYVNSSPPGMVASQYFIPPPPTGRVRWAVAPPPPEKKEEEPQPKRQKGNKAINFMISTPKNPPASKYNKQG